MADRVFNRMKRHVFRKRIPTAEVAGGGTVLVVLVLVLGWVIAQADNYDPGERDIAFAVLESQSVEDKLYKAPLKPWREPGSGGDTGPRLGPFPDTILDGPWTVGGRLQQFTPDNLYVKINGAAEQYIRYGNVGLHYIDLQQESGNARIGIELYDQGTFANGLGIFGTQRDPAKPIAREGELHYYETSVGAIGVMGQWFFKIAGSAETPEVAEKSRQLVRALSELPTEGGPRPFGFRVLNEGLGVPLADTVYQPQNAFQYDFARDFWFGRLDPPDPVQAFVHQSPDGAAAAELYEMLLTEQLYDYEVVEETESRTLLRHRFLDNYFAMVLDGGLIYGVENAPTVEGTRSVLIRLGDALAELGE